MLNDCFNKNILHEILFPDNMEQDKKEQLKTSFDIVIETFQWQIRQNLPPFVLFFL